MKKNTAKLLINMAAEGMALTIKAAAEFGGMTLEEAEEFAMNGFKYHGNVYRDMKPEEVRERVKEMIGDDEDIDSE